MFSLLVRKAWLMKKQQIHIPLFELVFRDGEYHKNIFFTQINIASVLGFLYYG